MVETDARDLEIWKAKVNRDIEEWKGKVAIYTMHMQSTVSFAALAIKSIILANGAAAGAVLAFLGRFLQPVPLLRSFRPVPAT